MGISDILLGVTLCKKNVNVIYLPTKHQRALGTRSNVSVRSRSNWNLVMLVFVEGGKPENPEKNPRSRDENQQQTQPTYDAESGNRTRATLVGGECSHHCAIPDGRVSHPTGAWNTNTPGAVSI